jgi:hypothetical protein
VVAGDMTVHSDRPLALTPFAVRGSHASVNVVPTTAAGTTRVVLAFPSPATQTYTTAPVTDIGFTYTTPHAHFCITSLQIASVREHVNGLCREIDIYGNPKAVAACGVPWQGKDPPGRLASDVG